MKCEKCGKEFEATRATAKFCSSTCRSRYRRLSVASDDPLALQEDLSVADEVGISAEVVDLVGDLNLDLKKDLGVTSWSADGIFIREDITVDQVQNIARLIHAKHNRPCPVFLECR